MGELGTLGLAGGPRGVQDHRGRIASLLGNLLQWLGLCQLSVELTGNSDDRLGPRQTRRLCGFLGKEREDHCDLGAAVVPDVGDLARLEQRIHRDGDRPDPQDRVVDNREVDDVRHDHRDPITGLHTAITEDGREPRYGCVEAAVAQCGLTLLDRW